MMKLRNLKIVKSKQELAAIADGKVLINTINAHSYNVAQRDEQFAEALQTVQGSRFMVHGAQPYMKCLIPDGASIVKACHWLKATSQPQERIAGWDLFTFEMQRLEQKSRQRLPADSPLRVMFMGSSEKVLGLIRKRAAVDFPNLEVVTYSPPYKPSFSDDDDKAIIEAINKAHPDLLWIGMTAPKQEKWTYAHWGELDIHCHVGTIGAVFDFYAGTAQRAPRWWQEHSLEWLYRLMKEPKRMWRRYVIGNPLFVYNVLKEKYLG